MKKTILVILTFLAFTNIASARSPIFSIEGETFYGFGSEQITEVAQEDICPSDAFCISNGTRVNIGYNLSCVSKLVSDDYKTIQSGNDIHIFINIKVGYLSDPRLSYCQAFAPVVKTIDLHNQYGQVFVHNLNGQAEIAADRVSLTF